MAQRLDKIDVGKLRKMTLWGAPKDSGKTTFALYGPGRKLHMMYDLGNVFAPPGVDPETIWVQSYPPVSPNIVYDSPKWTRPQEVGEKILRNMVEIHTAFREDRPIKFSEGEEEIPLPDTLILDGFVAMREHITDWIMGTSGKKSADDWDNSFTLWSFRLDKLQKMLNMMIPLPCNVVIITWETHPSTTKRTAKGIVTEKMPDIVADFGGALDETGPGKVDSSIYCFSEKIGPLVKYYVRLKPDALIHGVGVRGRYDGDVVVDVTIEKGKPNPWERVFMD